MSEKLIEAKIIVILTFEFNETARKALENHEKSISVHKDQLKDPSRLENLLSFDGFEQLKTHRNELLKLIKTDKLIRQEDVMKIVAPPNDMSKIKEAEGCFEMLKYHLEYMGLAVDAMQAIGIKPDGELNKEERIAINNIIDKLYSLKHPFDVECIQVESIDKFLEFLQERNVFKATGFKFGYNTSKNTIDELREKIKNLAKEKITKQIEKKILSDSFVSQEEIDTEADSIRNKISQMIKACIKLHFLSLKRMKSKRLLILNPKIMKFFWWCCMAKSGERSSKTSLAKKRRRI